MASGSINEDIGLFGPASTIWRVNRESVVTLGGTCAILMQFAHPKVAAGVHDHSEFEVDPAGRLRRTLDLTMELVFGTRQQALEAARTINRRHDAVVGPNYSAKDPKLLLWVQATLVYSAVHTYRTFVGSLSAAQADGYYQDTKEIGVLLGIPPEIYPAHVDQLMAYLDGIIESGEVAVGDTAREMAAVVLQPRFPGVPRMALMPLKTITAGLLPAPLRLQYGLKWGRPQQVAFVLYARGMPRLVSVAPPMLRFLPAARAAYRRVKTRRSRRLASEVS
jgi:uncharacterized protein (DUF2236 family)